MNDQTAKADNGKLRLTLVPPEIIEAVAVIRGYGVNKYPNGGVDNWKQVEKERYRDAAYRHFLAYLREPGGMDSESGLPHLWHCVCNFAFLCALETADGTLPKPQEIKREQAERYCMNCKQYTEEEKTGLPFCRMRDSFTFPDETCKAWERGDGDGCEWHL